MARKRVDAVPTGVGNETVVLWKAPRPLSNDEHEQLATKLRLEQEHSDVKIVLVPYSVDVEIQSAADVPEKTTDNSLNDETGSADDE
ncbi:hypothetical protein ACIFOE_22295 [Paenibacillus sp. NRS-1783]|uniref:hypothetical protein n=1 Tax=Paenibacillus sp. NRS-1783 TaxID=3233907 RepID=UPI003D2CAD30